jgi:hypothetical protein
VSHRPRLSTDAPRSRPGSSRWHPAWLLPLAVLYVLLRPLAAMTPPDPTWIAGLYDDADLDDVVTLVGGSVGIESATGPGVAAPDWRVTALAPSAATAPASSRPLSLPARSPPQA